ncbi:MAG: DUF4405 domain-containing protein [Chlorobiaceae bacterium]|nr:DUF4405 domain-containing protein [Chlorobiaceae bacterium]
MTQTMKNWATPLAVGAFTISAVTGLLIFFDLELGIVEPVHKWLSWLLVTGVILHLISNWKQFTGYFSKKPAVVIIGTALIVTIASVLPIFGEDDEEKEGGKEKSGRVAAQLLESSSLETVALVIKTTPQLLVEQLGKSGIIVRDPSLTIQQIANSNKKNEKEVLGAVLKQSKSRKTTNGDND